MNKLTEIITTHNYDTDEELAREVDTFLNIHTEEIQTDGKDTFHCHRYEPTSYEVLHNIFEQLPLTPEDTLLDYGSGLGRLSFYCNHLFRCGAIGVEMMSDLHGRAQNNLIRYRGIDKHRITFIQQSAEDYVVPDDVTVIYCFNPFSKDIFRSVIGNIERSYERCPRQISLVLYYPEDNTIFYIERHTAFQLVDEFAASDGVAKDRRERFCLYRLGI